MLLLDELLPSVIHYAAGTTTALMRLASVSRTWRELVGHVMRRRCSSLQQWSTASAALPDPPSSKKRRIDFELASEAIHDALLDFSGMPDLAFVFVSHETNKSQSASKKLAKYVSEMLPPSTMVIVVKASGVIGPPTRGSPHWETEDGAKVVVMLTSLPGGHISWFCFGKCASKSPEANPKYWHGAFSPHAREWWDPTSTDVYTSDWRQYAAVDDEQFNTDIHNWGPDLSREGGRLLVFSTPAGYDSYDIHMHDKILNQAALAAGGLALEVVLCPPITAQQEANSGRHAEAVGNLMLQLCGRTRFSSMSLSPNASGSGVAEAVDQFIAGGVESDTYVASCSEDGAPLSPFAAGLVFACEGRGVALHGTQDVDTCGLKRAVQGNNLAGFFSLGEIGPIDRADPMQPVNAVMGYACTAALIGQGTEDSLPTKPH